MIRLRPLVVVLGKGGVGRSTVARALAIGSARTARTALVEVNGARSLALAYGLDPAPVPRAVAPNLDLISLTAAGCLEDYVADRLRIAPLTRAVFRTRVMQALLDGIPGMSDLLHHGKIHSLLDPARPGAYDRVVVDAPATGHGLQFLETPAALAEMTRRGPLHDESLAIAQALGDPSRTAAAVVTLAEELPTTEALELLDGLGARRDVVQLAIANRLLRDPLPAEIPWDRLRPELPPALVAVGERLRTSLERQDRALARLRAGLGAVPLVGVPWMRPVDADAVLAALEVP